MATLRELKGRIGSVASSEKITGAMKMISSAKMHKAEQALKQLFPFRLLLKNYLALKFLKAKKSKQERRPQRQWQFQFLG